MQYDIVRQKRRFELLDKSSRKDVLAVNAFFGRYEMVYKGKIKIRYRFRYQNTVSKQYLKL